MITCYMVMLRAREVYAAQSVINSLNDARTRTTTVRNSFNRRGTKFGILAFRSSTAEAPSEGPVRPSAIGPIVLKSFWSQWEA